MFKKLFSELFGSKEEEPREIYVTVTINGEKKDVKVIVDPETKEAYLDLKVDDEIKNDIQLDIHELNGLEVKGVEIVNDNNVDVDFDINVIPDEESIKDEYKEEYRKLYNRKGALFGLISLTDDKSLKLIYYSEILKINSRMNELKKEINK